MHMFCFLYIMWFIKLRFAESRILNWDCDRLAATVELLCEPRFQSSRKWGYGVAGISSIDCMLGCPVVCHLCRIYRQFVTSRCSLPFWHPLTVASLPNSINPQPQTSETRPKIHDREPSSGARIRNYEEFWLWMSTAVVLHSLFPSQVLHSAVHSHSL